MLGGLFGKKGKDRAKGGLLGGALGGAGGALMGAGIGGESLSGMLFGKDRKIKAPKMMMTPLDPRANELINASMPARKKLLHEYQDEILKAKRQADPLELAKQITGTRMAQTERGLLGSREDQLRQLKEMTARRGLGNSSIGIGAALGVNRDIGQRMAQARADIRGGESLLGQDISRQQAADRMRALQGASAGIGSILSGMPVQRNMYQQQRDQTVRGPGLINALAPIGGALIGGKLGGAQGAAVGMQAGSGIGRIMQGMY
jgi:hypothetical protein